MSDSLLDIGTFPLFPLEINWVKRQPGLSISLARLLMRYPGTADALKTYSDDAPERLSIGITIIGKSDEYTLLDFFNSVRGRLGRFWIKTPSQEFSIKEPALSGSTSISVDRNGALNAYQGYERVWFEMANSEILTRKVVSLTDDDSNDRYIMALGSALDRGVNPDNCLAIRRLLLVRFDCDGLGLDMATDSVHEVSLDVVELVKEYSEV